MDRVPFPGTASPFTRGGPFLPSKDLFPTGSSAGRGTRWWSQQVIFFEPFLPVGHGEGRRNARVGPQANRPWAGDLPQVEGFDVSFDAHNRAQNFATVWPQALVHHLHGVLGERKMGSLGEAPHPHPAGTSAALKQSSTKGSREGIVWDQRHRQAGAGSRNPGGGPGVSSSAWCRG